MNPDPATLIDITNCGSAIEAEMLAQFLDDNGVPAHASVHAGATNPWELGSSVPFRIAVRKQDAERAAALIAEYRSHKHEPVEVNWDEEDVGEAEMDVVLPAPVEARRRHRRWRWMRRIGLLAIICAAMIWSGLLAAIIVLVACVIEVAAIISGESGAEETSQT
ncbi:MAG: DUF2007 domain-containing protein [Phycisphaeraceae bacterium]|nr:DUF2007 domain-containing protein [Phycisphaeraceae bacterium]